MENEKDRKVDEIRGLTQKMENQAFMMRLDNTNALEKEKEQTEKKIISLEEKFHREVQGIRETFERQMKIEQNKTEKEINKLKDKLRKNDRKESINFNVMKDKEEITKNMNKGLMARNREEMMQDMKDELKKPMEDME